MDTITFKKKLRHFNNKVRQKISSLRYLLIEQNVTFSENEKKLLTFKDKYKGKRCFIIGNGPSLNKLDLTLLKNEYTFGANAIYLNHDKMGFYPTFYVVEDILVAEDRSSEINKFNGSHKFFGNYLKYCLNSDEKTIWMNVVLDYSFKEFPNFSNNASRRLWVGGTVSYLEMQLAFYMGFTDVYLIGFDHSYKIPKSANVNGTTIKSTEDDPNHFHKDYFGKGKRWHDPMVDRMEKAYIVAKQNYEQVGRKIRNASAGGQLEVFDRMDYNSIFK